MLERWLVVGVIEGEREIREIRKGIRVPWPQKG